MSEITVSIPGLDKIIRDIIDSDNANTEQIIGVNEVEAIIDDAIEGINIENAVSDVIDNLDFEMLVRDYGNVDSIVEDYIYNNDICDKCWVEDELSKVHRDVRDEVLADVREEIGNTEALTNDIATLQAQIMGMQAEIDFLHEKYNDIYNRSLRGLVAKAWDLFTITCRRIVRRIPRITITKGGA